MKHIRNQKLKIFNYGFEIIVPDNITPDVICELLKFGITLENRIDMNLPNTIGEIVFAESFDNECWGYVYLIDEVDRWIQENYDNIDRLKIELVNTDIRIYLANLIFELKV